MKQTTSEQQPDVQPDVQLDVQRASHSTGLPTDIQLQSWALVAVGDRREQAEIALRIVDEEEGRELNLRYRNKDKPTNVLSFPADIPAEFNLPLLGDLVICAPVVAEEAEQQHKALTAHWAHMVVHGTLHLLGYDHLEDAEATLMEQLETRILDELGFADPYTPVSTPQFTNESDE